MKIMSHSCLQSAILNAMGSKALRRAGTVACFSILLAANAAADIPAPRVKPPAPNYSAFLIEGDTKTFRLAMRDAQLNQWGDVASGQMRLSDPVAKQILKWKRAADDPRVPFDVLTDVFHNQPDWPRMVRIRAKAEDKLYSSRMMARDVIEWFRGQDPVSGEGRAALARAYYDIGDQYHGDKWLKLAWREARLTRDIQKDLYGKFKNRLSKEDHAARADHLIWQGRRYYAMVDGLLPLMDKTDRALMTARMKVGGNRSGMSAAINAVPQTERLDTGLLFERARWRRKHRSESYALATFLQIKEPPASEHGKDRLWTEKKIMTYWALKNKRYVDAYNLTLNHGMTSGGDFAEAEFLAGWIALTYLDRNDAAAKHFATLKNGVSLPVSAARASYWQGRAAEAMNDAMALSYYADAARHPNTFYGQLAAEQLNPGYSVISLPPEDDGASIRETFERRALVTALHLLGEIQDERTFNQFAFHLDDIVQDKRELSIVSSIAKKYGFMKPSVRAAKQAGRLDVMLTESGYPTPDVITNLPAKYDIPFSLAIARQESEFNTNAASHASAYGMMQMINATARTTARRAGVKYQRSWLINDPEYAAELGSMHLNDLMADFGGSYILSAAAYNAGPSRVKQWIRTYGDPRTGEIDPIDWIENIPFTETRNYVQRVMENLNVYRARLNGNQYQLMIMRDITRGAF